MPLKRGTVVNGMTIRKQGHSQKTEEKVMGEMQMLKLHEDRVDGGNLCASVAIRSRKEIYSSGKARRAHQGMYCTGAELESACGNGTLRDYTSSGSVGKAHWAVGTYLCTCVGRQQGTRLFHVTFIPDVARAEPAVYALNQ